MQKDKKDNTDAGQAGGVVPQPWWRHGYVWLVLGGPLAVVIAGLVTAYLAVRHGDVVVDADYYRKGAALSLPAPQTNAPAMAPAVQARNHAATGVPAAADARKSP